MKQRQNVLFALAAGIAVAGVAAFLLGTEQGRNTTKALRKKGENMLEEVEEMAEEARGKWKNWRKNMTTCTPTEERKMAEQEN